MIQAPTPTAATKPTPKPAAKSAPQPAGRQAIKAAALAALLSCTCSAALAQAAPVDTPATTPVATPVATPAAAPAAVPPAPRLAPVVTAIQTPVNVPVPPPPIGAALGFGHAYTAALGHDALIDAARHERDVTQANVPVSFAALLPSVSFTMSDNLYSGTRSFPNALNQQVTIDLDYKAPQQALQMRAPIFNYESLSRYRQAKVQAVGADEVYRVRGVDLMDRLSVAYLQRMLADDNLVQIQAQIVWLQAQRERAQQRLQRGEGTRIEVADAQGQLDLASAKLLDVLDQVTVARRGLARITGFDHEQVARADDTMPTPPLQPPSLQEWQSLAARGNPAIQAREQTVEAARHGVQRNLSGHLPRLDVVASLSRNSNESLSTLNQNSRLASLGFQLNVPLYAGGGVQASIKQARSDVARTEAELANERRNVELEVQRQYLAVSHGAQRIQAYRQAVASAELVVEGVTRSVAAGLRTAGEVLEAGARLQLARRDLAQVRVEYLLARVRLQGLAGSSPAEVAGDMDRLLGRR